MLPNRENFRCDNLWKSIIMAVENPGKLMEFFFSYFVATPQITMTFDIDTWHLT